MSYHAHVSEIISKTDPYARLDGGAFRSFEKMSIGDRQMESRIPPLGPLNGKGDLVVIHITEVTITLTHAQNICGFLPKLLAASFRFNDVLGFGKDSVVMQS